MADPKHPVEFLRNYAETQLNEAILTVDRVKPGQQLKMRKEIR